jgi:hypothetical protein
MKLTRRGLFATFAAAIVGRRAVDPDLEILKKFLRGDIDITDFIGYCRQETEPSCFMESTAGGAGDYYKNLAPAVPDEAFQTSSWRGWITSQGIPEWDNIDRSKCEWMGIPRDRRVNFNWDGRIFATGPSEPNILYWSKKIDE